MNIDIQKAIENVDSRFQPFCRKIARRGSIVELTPRNGRKSFGGKAHVYELGDQSFLVSYQTIVSIKPSKGSTPLRLGKWSNTTSIHQKTYEEVYG